MSLYTIPPNFDFLEALGRGILEESKVTGTPLTDYRILLPNRRSCQNLREAFLNLTNGAVMLLPQIQPLGEIEEESLFFSGNPDLIEELANMPPAISATRRHFLLMRLIQHMEAQLDQSARPMDQKLKLAGALAAFLDQTIIEGVPLTRLKQIVPEDFAIHWQITLDFLNILGSAWPEILKEEGVIEAADRRNRLLTLQARHWRENPPKTPIIAAGSTGTMPATARLMQTIHGLPRGSVVLPGVDLFLDEHSWGSLNAAHPQYLFQDFLKKTELTRTQVKLWPYVPEDTDIRVSLITNTMRPVDSLINTKQSLTEPDIDILRKDLENIALLECASTREEAMAIALKLRETAETMGKTAALITPDRELARQVKLICTRWNIALDDTGGISLAETSLGHFLLQSVRLLIETFRPSVLLSVIKAPYFYLSEAQDPLITKADIEKIDLELRGNAPKDILNLLKDYKISGFLSHLQNTYACFMEQEKTDFHTLLNQHLNLLGDLAGPDSETSIWRGEDGESAALFFHELLQESDVVGAITPNEYINLIQELLKNVTLRPKYGTHPRLLITGQIEARLLKADVMILSGLNEGTWPPVPGADPWMSRPMRESFGLPDPERTVALAAHDFTQAFCAPEIMMTRTTETDGTLSVPARWLQRLDIYLKSLEIDPKILRQSPYLKWAQEIDEPEGLITPAERPQPTPPVPRRPNTLSVSAIELWMRDPYSLYARYILGLRKLDDIEAQSDFALRGSWLHGIFEWFVRTYPEDIPEDAVNRLITYALCHPDVPKDIGFYEPRLKRLLEWYAAHEQTWRQTAKPVQDALEIEGTYTFPSGFTLKAKADRIDQFHESGAGAIIDYKTGRIPSITEIALGLSPQMPLEALILQHNGFPAVSMPQVDGLFFWKLSGGMEAGVVKEIKGREIESLESLIEETKIGLTTLSEIYQVENVPYISLPDPLVAPPTAWQDYAQLARVAEWTALEEGEAA